MRIIVWIDFPLTYYFIFQSDAPPFPTIKSTHSLVAKHVTPEKWAKLGGLKTKTSGFTLGQVNLKCKFIFYIKIVIRNKCYVANFPII